MSNWMLDIFNRQHPAPQASTMPAPQAMQGHTPMQPPSRPVIGSGYGTGVTPSGPAPGNPGMDVMQVMQTKPPGVDPDTWMAVCGPGMQQPAGGTGQVGFRTANGDAGLQGANMPQPSGPFTYGGFAGGAPQQGGPQQMPAFQAPQPMPFMPQQPMPGMQPYNFSQQMGQTAPPSPMNGQMKGMFGVR